MSLVSHLWHKILTAAHKVEPIPQSCKAFLREELKGFKGSNKRRVSKDAVIMAAFGLYGRTEIEGLLRIGYVGEQCIELYILLVFRYRLLKEFYGVPLSLLVKIGGPLFRRCVLP